MMSNIEKELITYFENLGLDVHTSTKARGHQGFFLHKRIDVSKNISKERKIPTLVHEFAHYIHSIIEPRMERTGGTLEFIFNDENVEVYQKELLKVTDFVDANSRCEKLEHHKKLIKSKIIEYEDIIKARYPKFMRSKKFKEFDKYIKGSKAKYLLKHDRVKLISGILFKKIEIYTIDSIEKDFVDIPREFAAYIRLKSCQKRQARVSARINKLKKYYARPTELFARFVEGLYLDPDRVRSVAPQTYKRFYELLEDDYYPHLSRIFEILHFSKKSE